MILDFRSKGKINPRYFELFNEIANDIHEPFVNLIGAISREHGKRIDWWVSSPASRNTFVSPLFYYCCCIALLQKLLNEKESFMGIITDSKAFKKILDYYLFKHGATTSVTLARLPLKRGLKKLVRPIYVVFGIPLTHLLQYFAARQTRFLRKPVPSEPLILIDTFVMRGHIEKDRYYPGLTDSLSEEKKKSVWFAPHLYGFRPWQYLGVVTQLRKSERNFLLKDDFLKFIDYLRPWFNYFRICKLRVNPLFFQGIDISPVVREELVSFKNLGSSYVPLLNYRFAQRLKEAGVNLKCVIDWFENQVIDRGWNAGFRHFFPDVETIGYQGFFASAHYLCMYPTQEEKKSKVIPCKVAIMGNGLVRSVRRFCSDLDVFIVPAFRFQHVWRKRKYFPTPNEYTILVALPIHINEAIRMLNLFVSVANEAPDKIRFWIKPHPTTSESKIQKSFGTVWPERFEFARGNFGDCVERSNLFISSATSTCMETLAKGIPVIIVGNSFGLTEHPIPDSITDDIWRLCYTPEEIERAIKHYKSRDPEKIKCHEETGRRIREEYFEPVTRDGIRRFLRLDNSKVS